MKATSLLTASSAVIDITKDNFTTVLLISYALTVLIAIALYLFMAFGLKTMAKKREIKESFLAYIPFAQYVLIGKLAIDPDKKDNKLLYISIATAIIMLVNFAFSTVDRVMGQLALLEAINAGSIQTIDLYTFLYGSSVFSQIVYYIMSGVQLVEVFLTAYLLLGFFKKYRPQSYTSFAIVGALFGLTPLFVYAIRNNEPIDYYEYLKKRYGAAANRNGFPYNPYNRNGNPNAQNGNPYNNSGAPYGERPQEPDEPFAEFSNKSASSNSSSSSGSENKNDSNNNNNNRPDDDLFN